jgi:hypothetical protein
MFGLIGKGGIVEESNAEGCSFPGGGLGRDDKRIGMIGCSAPVVAVVVVIGGAETRIGIGREYFLRVDAGIRAEC